VVGGDGQERERNLQKRIEKLDEVGEPLRPSTDNIFESPEDDASDL
jgi:hypothetical protein